MSRKFDRRDILKTGAAAIVAGLSSESEGSRKAIFGQGIAGPESTDLKDFAVTHGGIQRVAHPQLHTEIFGQTSIRYMRFRRRAKIERLEIGRLAYGRWVPGVPVHPAHVEVSIFNSVTHRWERVADAEFPAEPEIMGAGLSQGMTIEEMDEHFSRILKKAPYRVELNGLETDHLRVVCDREHPVWPNHGECNGGAHNVPFGALHNSRAYGKPLGKAAGLLPYVPVLTRNAVRPEAPKGMRIRDLPDMLLYEGKYFSAGFSLKRPVLMHLGWDVMGEGKASFNRLFVSRQHGKYKWICGLSGPLVRTLSADYPSHIWTGEVSVEGNRIIYRNLRGIEGFSIDATFTIHEDRISIELSQTAADTIPVLESEAWRFAFDLRQGITGAAGVPTQRPGRNGDVSLPAIWSSDGNGCLSLGMIEGDSASTRFQVESYRPDEAVSGGLVFGEHPGPDSIQSLPQGMRRAVFELALTNFEPRYKEGAPEPGPAIKRHWATVFSCFRPEFRGFSNHSASVNCHLSQAQPMEIIALTGRHASGLNPLDLARFTIERAILDGGGYGYHRNLYLDSDPVLLSAAGRIHQVEPDIRWLRRIEPGIRETAERMLSLMGGEGLLMCRDLTGNSGSYRWSTNSMDIIGFGHMDGYVNAWAYRAFRNAAAMLDDLSGRGELVARCRDAASRIREQYAPNLLNPETGWIAGWRSRDGILHDYAFTWVNGAALAFGLLDEEPARRALVALEKKRAESGPSDSRMGIPFNLIPIHEEDHMLPRILGVIQSTYETYIDGALSGWPAAYYLRALATHGLGEHARKLAQEMAEGYALGLYNGGNGSGTEFRSWEGLPTGYEGTLIGCFSPLYAIAIEEGLIDPPEPEWWPANG